jgi:hypothetical protein
MGLDQGYPPKPSWFWGQNWVFDSPYIQRKDHIFWAELVTFPVTKQKIKRIQSMT